MSDRIEPMTHIDIRVVKNLLISRINEGKELMGSASLSTEWKKREHIFQEKCKKAIELIDEGIKVKEGIFNETNRNSHQNFSENKQDNRETGVQNQTGKA